MEIKSQTIEEKAEMLNNTKWGNDLNWNEIQKLAKFLDLYKFTKTEIIFEQGVLNVPMGLIVTGKIGITKEALVSKCKLIATLSTSSTFGEMSIIDGEATSAAAIALTDTTLLMMTKTQFENLIKEMPALGAKFLLKISKLLSQRLRKTSGKLVDLIADDS